jgi:hypothetical protein
LQYCNISSTRPVKRDFCLSLIYFVVAGLLFGVFCCCHTATKMTSSLPGQRLGLTWGEKHFDATRLEVFVDFTCPFSRRLFRRLTQEVIPHYGDKLDVVFFPMPQPWHPQSCMVHECYFAALVVAPAKYMAMMDALMDACDDPGLSDVGSYEKSRRDVHRELGALLAAKCGLDEEVFLDTVALKRGEDGSVNSGNGATRLLKFYVKLHRQLSIHVSYVTVDCRIRILRSMLNPRTCIFLKA